MKIAAEYIWLDSNDSICSFTKTLFIDMKDKDDKKINIVNELLNINVYSELYLYQENITLVPVSVRLDPFRKSTNVLVLSEIKSDDKSDRSLLETKLKELKSEDIAMMADFQFMLCPKDFYNSEESEFINRWRLDQTSERKVAEQAYHLGLESGLSLVGFSSTNIKYQWSITIGQHINVQLADEIIFLKYILQRLIFMFPSYTLEFVVSDTSNHGISTVCSRYNFSFNYGNMRNTKIDCSEIGKNILNKKINKEACVLQKNYENMYMIYDIQGCSKNSPYQELLKFL